jgi:hypothetical protein
MSFIPSGQSRASTSFSSLSAYFVIASTHCLIFFFSTVVQHLSQAPLFRTSSLAKPVLQLGQKFIGKSCSYAKPFSNILANIR